MKKIDLGQTITILANAGVLFGILLLVFELQQNRLMMRAQTRAELTQDLAAHLEFRSGNGELADIVLRGDSGEELTGVESRRYTDLTAAMFRYYENVHYQYRQGLYDENEFAAQRSVWQETIFSRPGVRAFYCLYRSAYSESFRLLVDELLENHRCV